MAKLISESVRTHIGKDALPTAFIWRRRLYRVVEVLSWWREAGNWWDGGVMRFFVRVIARGASEGTFELCRLGDNWFLERVLD